MLSFFDLLGRSIFVFKNHFLVLRGSVRNLKFTVVCEIRYSGTPFESKTKSSKLCQFYIGVAGGGGGGGGISPYSLTFLK